jgi:hypothetical protein
VQAIGTYPAWYTLVIVGFINVVVLSLTYVLFRRLHSAAKIQTNRWKAGGAIAGFIILTGVELQLVDHYSPTIASRPSYKVVRDFYNDLQYKRYADAWRMLHPSLRDQRWHGNFEAFKKGYKDTLNISLLAIMLETEGSAASDDYVVYYVDEVNSPELPGLERMLNLPIKSFALCGSSVDTLREKLRSEGFDLNVFDNIPMRNLLAADRGEKIGWILENQQAPSPGRRKFEDIFPQKRQVQFISAYRVKTQYTDDGWKILSTTAIVLEE